MDLAHFSDRRWERAYKSQPGDSGTDHGESGAGEPDHRGAANGADLVGSQARLGKAWPPLIMAWPARHTYCFALGTIPSPQWAPWRDEADGRGFR